MELKEQLFKWVHENSSKSKIIDNLNSMLPPNSLWRFDSKNILCTHHLLSGGSMHITKDKMNEFLTMYARNLVPNNLGVSESVHGQDFKYFMDLDYRNMKYKFEIEEVIEHAKSICKVVSDYRSSIENISDVEAALLYNDPRQDANGTWKAGVHMVFQNYTSSKSHAKIINSIIASKMTDLYPNFSWNEIIDNGLEYLRMPYSTKVVDNGTYRFIGLVNQDGELREEEDLENIIKLSSIRIPGQEPHLIQGKMARIPRDTIKLSMEAEGALRQILSEIVEVKDILNIEEVIEARKLVKIYVTISTPGLDEIKYQLNTGGRVLLAGKKGVLLVADPNLVGKVFKEFDPIQPNADDYYQIVTRQK